MIRQHRSAEGRTQRQVLAHVLDTLERRSFVRQIRSEECGCCTWAMAEHLLKASCDRRESIHRLIEILGRIHAFYALPRFTLEVLRVGLGLLDHQVQEYARQGLDTRPDLFQKVAEAIKELADKGEEMQRARRELLFCRIAEPLLRVSKGYLELCGRANVAPIERCEDVFDRLRGHCTRVSDAQEEDQAWMSPGRERNVTEKRNQKRIWSGGICEDLAPRRATPEWAPPRLKIISYSHSRVIAYSDTILAEGTLYEGHMRFNCVDLDFEVAVEVNESASASVNESLAPKGTGRVELRNSVDLWKLHVYVLDFKDNTPHPRYYFRSMCRDLIEQRREWPYEVFGELFCGDFHIASVLNR